MVARAPPQIAVAPARHSPRGRRAARLLRRRAARPRDGARCSTAPTSARPRNTREVAQSGRDQRLRHVFAARRPMPARCRPGARCHRLRLLQWRAARQRDPISSNGWRTPHHGAVAGVNYRGLRLRQPRLGARPFRRRRAYRRTLGARCAQRMPRAARPMRATTSTAFRILVRGSGPVAALGLDAALPSSQRRTALRVEIVARVRPMPCRPSRAAEPMAVVANRELRIQRFRRRSTRHIEVALPEGLTIAPAIISRSCRATIPRWWRRWRRASAFAGERDPARCGGRPPAAAAGRRRGVGRQTADRFRRAAERRDAPADRRPRRAHALPGHQTEIAGAGRRGQLSRRGLRQAAFGV